MNDGLNGNNAGNGNNANTVNMPPEYNNGVPPVPGAVWVNGFTRADGVLVRGYWRGSDGRAPGGVFEWTGGITPTAQEEE